MALLVAQVLEHVVPLVQLVLVGAVEQAVHIPASTSASPIWAESPV